jgi:hypothetical protein
MNTMFCLRRKVATTCLILFAAWACVSFVYAEGLENGSAASNKLAAAKIEREKFRQEYMRDGLGPYKEMSLKELWARRPAGRIYDTIPYDENSLCLMRWHNALHKKTDNPYRGLFISASKLWKMKPPLHKVGSFIPQDEGELRMWQWAAAMEKADRNFARKMPIEFYGVVVDQYSNRVANATVLLSWAATWDSEKKTIQSDANGQFSVKGIRGRLLTPSVRKDGYRGGEKSRQTFNYSDFADSDIYIPDAANPVVFRLWKYENPEPMFLLTKYNVVLPVDDRVVWMDIENGAQIAETGQIGFSVLRENPTNLTAGFAITIQAAEKGGVKCTEPDDELMFLAPENGYQPYIRIEQKAGMECWGVKKQRFYLRTPSGKYAAISITVGQYNNPKRGSDLEALIYFNPSGSRNLQYRDDLRMRENPKPIDNG